ncbi:MAG TPA: hypothetical protein VFN10_19850 [Thermoanaerobaculia bacterium]|nr:hypothetical protein [Thermoanaerobaculia bacterium]
MYIDVGNQSCPGVIDTHADSGAEFECSSTLIAERPHLITDWITPAELAGSVRMVMHENPDYDCIVSSLLARRLLEARADGRSLPEGWDSWARLAAESARRIDRGETRIKLPIRQTELAITPYLSTIALHAQIELEALTPREVWRQLIERGQAVIECALDVALARGVDDLEAIDLRGALGSFGNLEAILDARVQAFQHDARRIDLFGETGSRDGVDGVFAITLPISGHPSQTAEAKIACIRAPESGAGFFKSVIRGTYADRIQATCIFMTVPRDQIVGTEQWVRPVISVDPDSGFDLRGLGSVLDEIETEARKTRGVPRAGIPRPGFKNSDPWYDGRAFAHTIVDAPRWGTVLHPREVLKTILDSAVWRSKRVAELVSDMLARLRAAEATVDHGAAYDDIASALSFWNGRDDLAVAALYVDCLDAIGTFATPQDRSTYMPLARQYDDVVLSLLTSADPAVRTDALMIVGQRADTLREYATRCDREDLKALASVVAGNAVEAVTHLLVAGQVTADHELLLDAASARIAARGADVAILDAAVALAERTLSLRRVWPSILNLGRAARDAGVDMTLLATVVRKAEEAASTVPLDDANLSSVAAASRALVHTLSAAHPTVQRDQEAIFASANTLLEMHGASDETAAHSVADVVARLRRHFGTDVLLQRFTARAADTALRISADFLGALIRVAEFEPKVRWQLLTAALSNVPAQTIARVRRMVFRVSDAHLHRQLKSLRDAAATVHASDGCAPASQCREIALLLLASFAGRGADSSTSSRDLLGAIAEADNLPAVADEISLLRCLIRDELRHVTPDHLLLADAETSLAKAELLVRCIAIIGRAETTTARAIRQFLLIGLSLPEIDFAAVDELLRRRRDHRPTSGDDLEVAAQRVFACAAILVQARGEALLINDGDRARTATTAIAELARDSEPTPLGWVVRRILRDLESVLEGIAAALETASSGDDESIDAYSLRVLQASTLASIADGVRQPPNGNRAVAAAHVVSRLAQARSSETAREVFARTRRAVRTEAANPSFETATHAVGAQPAHRDPTAVDILYARTRTLMAIPAATLNAAYARLVDGLVSRYDMERARKRIDDYTVGRATPLLRFWMSGWTVLIPLVLLSLFVNATASASGLPQIALGACLALVLCSAVAAIVLATRSRSLTDPVESLRYRLLLPHYLVPVLIGVYTAAVTHEIAARLALWLDGKRYILVSAGLFVCSVWALSRLIRRTSQNVAHVHVLIAAGRLLAYAFVIGIFLNLLLANYLDYEFWLHGRHIAWVQDAAWAHPADLPEELHPEHLLLPARVVSYLPLSGAQIWFPRHILLDALFGMFIGIFVRRFWRLPAEQE